MLQLKHITIKDLKNRSLIEDFSYSLSNEGKVGIIGEEGNGKSTLLKAIKDINLIKEYTVIEGTIEMDHKAIAYFEQRISSKWDHCQIYEYLLKEDVEDEIEPHRFNELSTYETLCQKLFLSGDFIQRDQEICTLSGGEKVKLQLLKLMNRPMDVLLMDEPTNDLDLETLEWLEQFLLSLQIPLMFISHDETLLNHVANELIHLEQLNKKTKCKVTVYKGTYENYVEERLQNRVKEVQLARKEKQEYIKKKIKLNDQMNAVHDALNDTVRNPKQGALLKNKMKNIKALEKRFENEGYTHVDSVEEAIDVYFTADGLPVRKVILDMTWKEIKIANQVLLKDVSLQVYGKDKIVFIGKNGCGKSVFMKAIYDQLKDRTDLNITYMPQNYEDFMNGKETPVSFLLQEADRHDVTIARELLGRMKFTREEMLHNIEELSEGQKAKLYLLKAMKMKSNVLLLDEPTRNLSPLTNPVIREMLQDFEGCILAVSHDRMLIQEVFQQKGIIEQKTLTMTLIEK